MDAFVSGAGTGGTIAGVGCYLKQRRPAVRVFLIDPPGSGLYNKVGGHEQKGWFGRSEQQGGPCCCTEVRRALVRVSIWVLMLEPYAQLCAQCCTCR